jgi:hydrogenase maturation protease
VAGVGQPYAGDDAAGLALIELLKREEIPAHIAITALHHPIDLVHQLAGYEKVILVDAVRGDLPEGEVILLPLDRFLESPIQPVSSHGIGLPESLRLLRILDPDRFPREILVLGIAIGPPVLFSNRLSPPIDEAVRKGARRISGLLELPAMRQESFHGKTHGAGS